MKRLLKYLMILPLLATVSCVKERAMGGGPATDAGQKSVMLKVAVPYVAPQGAAQGSTAGAATRSAATQTGAAGAGTRSIDAPQENSINTLDVLAFKVDGTTETFLYWAEASRSSGSDGVPLQSFNAMLRVADYQQHFVLVTNARDKVATLVGSRVDGWVGQEKEAMLSKLTVDLGGGDRWNAISATNYTAIPMWGESQPAVISGTTTSIGSIKMLRMVAKVDVQLDQTVAGLTDIFKLKSVHVYNTNTSGRVVPMPGAVDATMVAQTPSLPASVASVVGPLDYSDFSAPGIPDIAMTGAVYLFETAAKNAGNQLEETCIVVGGLYGSDTAESYYRLDFFVPGGVTVMDILRNYRYLCNIIAVNGRGYPSVDDAYRAKSFNMIANILAWNEGVVGDVVFDGQYMLAVDQNPFALTGDDHNTASTDNILTVTTDYPTGWTAAVWADKAGTTPVPNDPATGGPWLHISPAAGAGAAGGGAQSTAAQLIAPANAGAERTAYVLITAGRLTYIETVTQATLPPGTITFSPDNLLLPYQAPTDGTTYSVTVTALKADSTNDPNASWTLTSADPTWCRLSTSSSTAFSAATASVSGTGSTTVYVIASDNSSINYRMTTIYSGADPAAVTTTVMQWGNPGSGNITDNEGAGTPPTNVLSYVGAFWRAAETGERVIRIDMSGSTANYGTWSAQVMWLDKRWGPNDMVVLSTDQLPGTTGADPNIYTANPGNAEDYQVGGMNLIVSGTADATNKYVTFRIGLRSQYTPTASDPARYAVVLLSYSNQTKYQKIFLRQGEGADYLMTNNDAITTGGLGQRTMCRQFSPFNLTATTLDAAVMTQADAAANVAGNKTTFVDYPTKAGAFFMWANTYTGTSTSFMGPRYASNPYTSASAITWGGINPGLTTYWNSISANQETCPPGYRRPTDGSTSAEESCTSIAASEFRQSIFSKPLTGWNYSSTTANGLWGYYADGWFDRRPLVNGTGTGATNTTVASGTKDIAHVGVLFFNPTVGSDHYNASIFFPATGLRYYSNGTLQYTGTEGDYWSSSANNVGSGTPSNCGLGMIFRNYSFQYSLGPWRIEMPTGLPIRCVKAP